MLNKLSTWILGEKTSDQSAVDRDIVVYAPLDGRVIYLEEVPDPVFAQKMLGDGVAIEPSSRKVLAPFDGKVVTTFPTQHAIGLRSAAGMECLIHVGIDTVTLNGRGFHLLVEEGQMVKQGSPLIDLDLDILRSSGNPLSTPVIIINSDRWPIKQRAEEKDVIAGKGILFVVRPVE